jgi:hypothetical protein
VIGWASGVAASTVHAILRRNACAAEAAVGSRRGDPLRAAAGERARPHRLQETRPDHPTRRARYRRPDQAGERPDRLGSTSSSRSTTQHSSAFAELPDETFRLAIGFLAASERFYARGGLETKRLMTDG